MKVLIDAEFRKLLGPEFDRYDDEELAILLDAVLESMQEIAERIAREVPIIPGFGWKV